MQSNTIAMGVPALMFPTRSVASRSMDNEPELACRVRALLEKDYEERVATTVMKQHADEIELSILYDRIVESLQNSPRVTAVKVMRLGGTITNAFYYKYDSVNARLLIEPKLNARLGSEHGIMLQGLDVSRIKRCLHRFCDCGDSDCGIPCMCWNIFFGCIPLVYWIPRIFDCMIVEDWCITATVATVATYTP